MNKEMVLCREGKSEANEGDKEVFEEERTKKKLIYILGVQYPWEYDWIVGDPFKCNEIYMHKAPVPPGKDRPPDFLEHRGYGVAVLGSKIYFMGGFLRSTLVPSDAIFIFDTQSNTWETPYRMKQARACPNVFVYESKIYVFGLECQYLNLPDDYSIPLDQWAEYFDLNSNLPYYLPSPPEEFPVRCNHLAESPAIDYNREKVYFCNHNRSLYGYSFKDENWFDVDLPPPDEFPYLELPLVNWSTSVVVIRSVLFSHHFGTIYGLDLSKDDDFSKHGPVPMCSVPGASKIFGDPERHFGKPPPSYLVNVGNGTLCLVYYVDRRNDNQPLIQCHRFRVLFAPTRNQVDVSYLDTQTLPQKLRAIDAVLELNYIGGPNKNKKKKKNNRKEKKTEATDGEEHSQTEGHPKPRLRPSHTSQPDPGTYQDDDPVVSRRMHYRLGVDQERYHHQLTRRLDVIQRSFNARQDATDASIANLTTLFQSWMRQQAGPSDSMQQDPPPNQSYIGGGTNKDKKKKKKNKKNKRKEKKTEASHL